MTGRAKQRGKPLDDDCRRLGRTTTNEYGADDKRVFCYGLYYGDKDWPCTLEKCEKCGAYVHNATPQKAEEARNKRKDDV